MTFTIAPDVQNWLLEQDEQNPSIRYFTLRDLLDAGENDKEVQESRSMLMRTGPVPVILSHQDEAGFWVEPGSGYRPKYTSTVWSLIMLAQLGADGNDVRVKKACQYVLDQSITKKGCFSMNSGQSGSVHCLQGNLAAALIKLGLIDDPHLIEAINWMSRSVTGKGFGSTEEKHITPHYIRSGISGPGFLCSANGHQPCAWGAVKVGWALSQIPSAKHTKSVEQAIKACRDFLTSIDPSIAEYPHPFGKNPSTSWFKFGFPVFYVTDLLQNMSVMLTLGLKDKKGLANAVALVESKADANEKWPMEYTYNGKTWVDVEEKKKPSKWVTLRALTVLNRYYRD